MEEISRLKIEIADLKKDNATLLDNIEEKDQKIAELSNTLPKKTSTGLPPTGKQAKKK